MKKNTLVNLALLLVVVALVLVTVYEPGIEKPAEAPPLVSLDRDAINHIAIQRDGQKAIELKKNDDGSWQLVHPLNIAASDFRIDSLLRISKTKSLASFVASKEKLAEYHLQQPKVELILNGSTHILFGDNTPLDHRRYVMIGDHIHLISDTLYYHLIGAYPTFIRQKPLPKDASISALELPELKLQWQDSHWQVDPKPDDYSADRVTQLLDAWKFASAMQVKSYDGNPGDKITLQLKGQDKPLEFLLTTRNPDLVLARPDLGIEYHFPESSADELLKLPAAKEDKDADTKKTDGVN